MILILVFFLPQSKSIVIFLQIKEQLDWQLATTNMSGEGERKKKESILDLSRFIDKQIRVKFAGGRECSGLLKGYDPLLNIVLDDTIEYLR